MQTYTLEQETAPTLDRTESQVEKQLKVHQVQQRLAGQQQPVRELLAAAGSPAPRSEAPAEMLEEIIRQQKTARNIGEDLLEDMLKLDSLAGLFQADREVRKLALSQLDDLVDQVDTAKAQLLKKRKELEAMVADEVATDANPAQLEKEVSPPQSPTAESMEPEASRSQNESPRLEDIRCRLRLRSQERPQGYVVSANARGVSAEDVDLQLDGDLLRITGFARPTLQDAAFLRSRLRREPSVEDYAAFGFGRFQEAIRVPADVDVSKIQASCHDGQLQLILPRRPRQFPQSYHSLRSRPPMFPVW